MSTSNKISQLDLFEEALKGLTPKEDDEVELIPPIAESAVSESMSTQPETCVPYKSEESVEAKARPIGKQYILIPKRFLISRANTQFVSANYQQCDEIPDPLDYNMAQSEEAHQQRYDIRAACERQWLGKTFRLPRNRCNRIRSAQQTNGPNKKTSYKIE